MTQRLTYSDPADLKSAIARIAGSNSSASAILSRIQSVLMHSHDAAALCKRPDNRKRNALLDAMMTAQSMPTRDGGTYAACIICGAAMAHPTMTDVPTVKVATLTVLIPSVLFRTDEAEVVAAEGNTSVQAGWVPGNIALAHRACNSARPVGDCLLADTIDPSVVLLSWEGIGYTTWPKRDDATAAVKRYAALRQARGFKF